MKVLLSNATTTMEQRPLHKTLFVGTSAGLVSTFVSHPLDTLKTRVQLKGGSTVGNCLSLFRDEGPGGFFRGVAAPAYTTAIKCALGFLGKDFWFNVLGGNTANGPK